MIHSAQNDAIPSISRKRTSTCAFPRKRDFCFETNRDVKLVIKI